MGITTYWGEGNSVGGPGKTKDKAHGKFVIEVKDRQTRYKAGPEAPLCLDSAVHMQLRFEGKG